MGDVGIESTLVLDGLAVSKVRFYSTLDSDVGKRVEITDKFNPLNVFTGTFDESLNLLYDLPAFTSYRVKMYGLDGETVESDQSFMLKGYDYLEKNVGLNKNSFAGIKAIVDQGLEDSMIEIGHEFSEDDNVGDDGGVWIIVAKNHDPFYRHSVYLARKYLLPGKVEDIDANVLINANVVNNAFTQALNGSYYNALPASIKQNITPRKVRGCYGYDSAQAGIWSPYVDMNVWYPCWVEYIGNVSRNTPISSQNYTATAHNLEAQERTQFAYFKTKRPATIFKNGNNGSAILMGSMKVSGNTGQYAGFPWEISGTAEVLYRTAPANQSQRIGTNLRPYMMIASDPIE